VEASSRAWVVQASGQAWVVEASGQAWVVQASGQAWGQARCRPSNPRSLQGTACNRQVKNTTSCKVRSAQAWVAQASVPVLAVESVAEASAEWAEGPSRLWRQQRSARFRRGS